MRILRFCLSFVVLLLLVAGSYVAAEQWPAIVVGEPPLPTAFDAAVVRNGAQLAAIGDCRYCHTAPGGADYAGNRAIPTSFGSVRSSNITPAPGSGIGRWSEAAFRRAMRDGISRTGAHLYPAFPYDHFTRLSDKDIAALYAFLMTRRPVDSALDANTLPFPLNQRWMMTFWNTLFFRPARFEADPQHDTEWNRGAYLVAGLGHCGDCHTPRNLLGAEEKDRALSGGESEGWTAPALNAASPAPGRWDAEHLFAYLRQGWDGSHDAAAGPMRPVVDDLATADEADVRAIATYIAALQTGAPALPSPAKPAAPASGEERGAALFAGACAPCHAGAAAMPPHELDLALSTTIHEADPRNAIRVVLDGIAPGSERAGPFMPPFSGTFSNADVAALLAYVRAHYGGAPAWSDLDAAVRAIRSVKKQP